MKRLQEVITKIKKSYEILICGELDKENIFDISLPIFLNTGDAVNIKFEFLENDVVLTNTMYRSLERTLKNEFSYTELRKEYLINNEKFKSIISEILEPKDIKYSLMLEKKIELSEFEKNLEFELFQYVFCITRYYNYVYDYIISHSREAVQVKAFNNEIKKFVKDFNSKIENNKIEEIKNGEYGTTSTYNQYYCREKIIITGINSKVHLLEALRDIDKIFLEKNSDKAYILIDSKKKNDLTKEYIEKNLYDPNKKELIPFYIEENSDMIEFEKIINPGV